MVISCYVKGMFYWVSLDGSLVFIYFFGYYGNDLFYLFKSRGQ